MKTYTSFRKILFTYIPFRNTFSKKVTIKNGVYKEKIKVELPRQVVHEDKKKPIEVPKIETESVLISFTKIILKEWTENEAFRNSVRNFFAMVSNKLTAIKYSILAKPEKEDRKQIAPPKLEEIRVLEILNLPPGASAYEILNCKKEDGPDKITENYKKLVKIWHPDINEHPEAEKVFKLIVKSYSSIRQK